MTLPDPRRYGSGANPLLRLDETELVATFRELAAAGRDNEIRNALAAAPSQAVYARLFHALCGAIERPPSSDSVATRVFAIPWVIVCSATAEVVVDCVVRDITAVAGVLEQHHVFGGSRNLGLSNALCSIEALEALPPSAVLASAQSSATRDIAPSPIALQRGEETVHVRFLLGAAIAPAHAPDIVETGGNVAMWGTPALRAMAAQLATPDAQVLPMPRPPRGLYSAAHAGRRAALEAALNLFMSNSVRRMRLAAGDPCVTVAAHEGAEVRVTLTSAFDDTLIEQFRWPLHPADDLRDIERTIAALAEECRLSEPAVVPQVQP